MINEKLLKPEEKAVFDLRSLYAGYGYLPYKMSKFEEYELYMKNKDFLTSDRVITFNDTDGKLLALKPDVTLSIIKSTETEPGCKRKVCYSENVYRVSARTHRYKEIMQAGLECIGDVDLYDVYEVILLAAESLARISGSFVLEISHLGLLSAALSNVCPDAVFAEKALGFIKEKNAHDLARLCREYGLSDDAAAVLLRFVTAYGERGRVLDALDGAGDAESLSELRTLSELLSASPYSDRILFDFSLVNDMNYYNGFVFRGFIDGISEGVLAGGQYDGMMKRMGNSAGAIGFAVYLDLLEQLAESRAERGVDALVLYDAGTGPEAVAREVRRLTEAGLCVSAQHAVPSGLKYGRLIDLRKEAPQC